MSDSKISKIWNNRSKILEGVWNATFPKEYIENIAEERLSICRSNICGVYDPEGKSQKAVLPGFESCGGCGCSLKYATRALSKNCGLEELNREPLWKAILTQEQEDTFRSQTGIKNE